MSLENDPDRCEYWPPEAFRRSSAGYVLDGVEPFFQRRYEELLVEARRIAWDSTLSSKARLQKLQTFLEAQKKLPL